MLRLPHCEHRRRSRQSGTVVWCAVVRGYFGRVGLDVAKFICGRPAPAKDVEFSFGEVVRCSHMSGPLMRYI